MPKMTAMRILSLIFLLLNATASYGLVTHRKVKSISSHQLLNFHHQTIQTNNISPLFSSVEDTTISVPDSSNSAIGRIRNAFRVVYKFSRPHTIKGTILASSMGVARALIENPTKINWNLVPRAIVGLIALLCGNAFIVGINQIYDVKIDEINKPFLPIAAKTMPESTAWLLVISCLFTGVGIVKTQFSSQIFSLYFLGVILGTIYSVPPIQLKRFPFFAGTTIAVVRGFLLNYGVYYAVREALNVPFRWNPVVLFISSFMTIFASVIAVTKDLPDIEGDQKYQISTFAAKFGVKAIARAATAVLSSAYIMAMVTPAFFPGSFRVLPMVLGHAAMLVYFLQSYRELEADRMDSVKRFYKKIWNLFYLEYILYPFI